MNLRTGFRLLAAAASCLFVTSCSSYKPVSKKGDALAQGWSYAESKEFWFTSQGSMLVPYAWFLNLEQPGSQTKFRDDVNMDRLRFLPAEQDGQWNPDALPIGFTKEKTRSGNWEMMGLTCAACHTSRIELNGKTVQVEGGPAMADFETFLEELVASLQATASQNDKFERFAQNVVGEKSGAKADALKTDLQAWTKKLGDRMRMNKPTHAPGYARVDALGNILNEVVAQDLGIPENAQAPDAPVSYPVIWDGHAQDYVQWNGSAPNADPGSLLRNAGEVLGVFGTMQFSPREGRLAKYPVSSVDIQNLKRIEDLVTKLWSPVWPESFPAIDQTKAAAGRELYKANCIGCHALVKRDDPDRYIKVHMISSDALGVDNTLGERFLPRTSKTGSLKGSVIFLDPAQRFGDVAPSALILRNAVFGVMIGKNELGLPKLQAPLTGNPEADFERLQNTIASQKEAFAGLLGTPVQLTKTMYKARPLNGVWSSAPYLHNGSVPSLAEMLKKPGDRVKQFYVGSRQYDPKNVGFMPVASEGGVNYYSYDTTVKGNGNTGHDKGTSLSDEQKLQLIEYLKTL